VREPTRLERWLLRAAYALYVALGWVAWAWFGWLGGLLLVAAVLVTVAVCAVNAGRIIDERVDDALGAAARLRDLLTKQG
jgi:hypothetical protein